MRTGSRQPAVHGLLATLIACIALSAAVRAQSFDLEEVAPGVYAVSPRPGVPAGANAAFIVNHDHVVVVDTHMRPSFARDLLAEIRARVGLPVRYVVNTHWHPDHTQGTQAYTAAFPGDVTILSHAITREEIATLGLRRLEVDRARLPRDIAMLRERLGPLEASTPAGAEVARIRRRIAEQEAFLRELRQTRLVLPHLTFSRVLGLHGSDRRIQLLYFGSGHTGGDTVVYLPAEKVAIVGDLVTGGPPFARDGYPAAWGETLSRIQGLDIDVIVPGHGRVRRGKGVIEDRARFLESALGVIGRGLADGWTVDRIAAAIDLDGYRDTFDPEPPDAPWRGWMRMLVERAIAEDSTGRN